jgi:predicted adenylyl cyclase CyaB
MHINVEFKAYCNFPDKIREILKIQGADYKGRDHQVDIYFNVPNGRLKLRKGNIENSLISYQREDIAGSKQSNVHLFHIEPGTSLEEILTTTLGVKVVVDKQRDIYFIENVKFHVDEVQGLGSFVEVEAIDLKGDIGREKLQQQCNQYKKMLGVKDEDLIAQSYSDLLLIAKINP